MLGVPPGCRGLELAERLTGVTASIRGLGHLERCSPVEAKRREAALGGGSGSHRV